MKQLSVSLIGLYFYCFQSYAGVLPQSQIDNPWFTQAQAHIQTKLERKQTAHAKKVILFIGDGMGISTLTASRILDGQNKGKTGEEGLLSFELFPYSALIKTYNVDAQTPDSAGTMTAIISGVKTNAGTLGVDEDIVRGDCSTVKGNELVSALELAELKGLATGIVSTARITHATPAATYAKSAERNWEDISDMPKTATECEDIALQLINFEQNLEQRFLGSDVDGIEIIMGGGRRHFLPNDPRFNVEKPRKHGAEGDRTDGRNLVDEWQNKYKHGTYINNSAGFSALNSQSTQKLLALFNESHMQYEAQRLNDIAGEPSLTQMTQKAMAILNHHEQGYFLVVESGRIDHAHHQSNAHNALTETIEFSKAIQAAVDMADEETLILVTADHSHVFTIAGYPKRGNPILGKVVAVNQHSPELANDNMPYTTLGYSNGMGFKYPIKSKLDHKTSKEKLTDNRIHQHLTQRRYDLTDIDTTDEHFHQESLIPMRIETHGGEDVSLHAYGPGAYKAQGVMEQNAIFHLIRSALDLDGRYEEHR